MSSRNFSKFQATSSPGRCPAGGYGAAVAMRGQMESGPGGGEGGRAHAPVGQAAVPHPRRHVGQPCRSRCSHRPRAPRSLTMHRRRVLLEPGKHGVRIGPVDLHLGHERELGAEAGGHKGLDLRRTAGLLPPKLRVSGWAASAGGTSLEVCAATACSAPPPSRFSRRLLIHHFARSLARPWTAVLPSTSCMAAFALQAAAAAAIPIPPATRT